MAEPHLLRAQGGVPGLPPRPLGALNTTVLLFKPKLTFSELGMCHSLNPMSGPVLKPKEDRVRGFFQSREVARAGGTVDKPWHLYSILQCAENTPKPPVHTQSCRGKDCHPTSQMRKLAQRGEVTYPRTNSHKRDEPGPNSGSNLCLGAF